MGLLPNGYALTQLYLLSPDTVILQFRVPTQKWEEHSSVYSRDKCCYDYLYIPDKSEFRAVNWLTGDGPAKRWWRGAWQPGLLPLHPMLSSLQKVLCSHSTTAQFWEPSDDKFGHPVLWVSTQQPQSSKVMKAAQPSLLSGAPSGAAPSCSLPGPDLSSGVCLYSFNLPCITQWEPFFMAQLIIYLVLLSVSLLGREKREGWKGRWVAVFEKPTHKCSGTFLFLLAKQLSQPKK